MVIRDDKQRSGGKSDLSHIPRRSLFAPVDTPAPKPLSPKQRKTAVKAAKAALAEIGAPATAKPRPAGKGELIGVRMQPEFMARLDEFRGEVGRAEAIREILDIHLPKIP